MKATAGSAPALLDAHSSHILARISAPENASCESEARRLITIIVVQLRSPSMPRSTSAWCSEVTFRSSDRCALLRIRNSAYAMDGSRPTMSTRSAAETFGSWRPERIWTSTALFTPVARAMDRRRTLQRKALEILEAHLA